MTDQEKLTTLMKPVRLEGAVYDNLYQLVRHGAREAGEVPSKGHMGELLKNGWVTQQPNADKCWTITEAGIQTFLEEYDQIPNPHYKIFGVIRICFAERCGDSHSQLDGIPIRVFGGALEWAQANVISSHLTWAASFGAYDYATFDFTHPVTKVVTHLKPGDWIILSEDHNHTVHKLSEAN